jgi:aspartate aminotransferase
MLRFYPKSFWREPGKLKFPKKSSHKPALKIIHIDAFPKSVYTTCTLYPNHRLKFKERLPDMSISRLARSIVTSPTLKLNEEARLLKEKGESVINLGIGEPKNKTPINAILSSAAMLNAGEVKYTPTDGIPSLKQAILRYTEENYDKLVQPENVIVCDGAKQCLFNIFYTLLNPQDEVIILAPHWVSYPEIVKMVYGRPVIVTPENGGFHPRMEDILRAVSPLTKAMIINNPNNPSGVIYSDEFICEIVEFCEKKGIYLVTDDIYHKLVFDGLKPAPAYRYSKKDIESTHIIVVNGISKLYGMTGFRIGWVVAPRELVQVMTNIQAQTISCVSGLLQAAAVGALNGLQSVVENLRLTIQNNRDVVMQELKSFNGVRCESPQGTFYCLPDFRSYKNSSIELSNLLLKKALVVTVPGIEFGMEGHLRLSFSGSVKDLTEGIARMKWALDPTSPNEIYIGDRKQIRDWL